MTECDCVFKCADQSICMRVLRERLDMSADKLMTAV